MILPEKIAETGIGRQVWLKFNQLREYVGSLRLAPGKFTFVRHTSLGQMVDVDAKAIVAEIRGTELRTFRIRTIGDDALTCREWDGETEGTKDFTIAKPWTLRRHVYEAASGATMTYTYVGPQERTATGIATDGTTKTETHLITKAYTETEMIVAAKLDTIHPQHSGHTHIRLKWEWLDLNMDGRDWARKPG